ncbi:MAG TPA: hypothetical protein DHW40_11025, partial [Microbacterium sp.]|nr:hypothetical protein [Microbacterium sp.]
AVDSVHDMSATSQTTRRRSASTRTTTALLVAVAAMWMFVGCTVDTSQPAAVETTPAPTPRETSRDPEVTSEQRAEEQKVRETCASSPERADTGPRDGAGGTVHERDDEGLATIYVLAERDNLQSIADRFCLDVTELQETYAPDTTLYAGEHIALSKESYADARRASGYLFPACPVDANGSPKTASISWESAEDDSPIAHANISGEPIDTGEAYGARGTARTNADGELVDYTVAQNDNWRSIRDRFCFDLYYMTSLTGAWASEPPVIHPGDVIPLQPKFLEMETGAPPTE